jgi:hypothetical protein
MLPGAECGYAGEPPHSLSSCSGHPKPCLRGSAGRALLCKGKLLISILSSDSWGCAQHLVPVHALRGAYPQIAISHAASSRVGRSVKTLVP